MSELINPLMENTPRRGRPSKTAAVYIDGVLVVKESEREEINNLAAQIDTSITKAKKHITDAVVSHFALGEIIETRILPRWVGKCTAQEVAEKIQIPAKVVLDASKIYKGFKDNREALEGMAVSTALAFLREQKKVEKTEQVQYALPSGQVGYNEDESFGLPTASGIPLSTYRFRAKDGKFYLLHKGFPTAIPVASVTVDQPKTPSQQMAYDNMMVQTQKAFEEYYATIEAEMEE
nr:MAG TPA: hypothetical protein [Caudoviricetes sp.]